ncbi:MAG: pyridoxal phosphate-dependent aminotransferase [Bacteroidales bacterium]
MNNIKPADRIAKVEEYYFSRKLKEIAELNAQGKGIINLGIGSPDLPPSAETIETLTIEASKHNTHGYQSYNGVVELRSAFSNWYAKWFDVELNPSNEILPLIGSKEGILHISMAFLNPGDSVLVPNPGYPTYSSLSKIVGANVVLYDLTEEGGWLPDFDQLESMDLSGVKLMWVNYPNMPTGTKATRELFVKLVDFARRHNIVVVNDNPYSFVLNKDLLSILQVPGAKDVCIEMNSLSKSHNMPGWRIGMLASNPQFVEWIIRVKSNIDSGMFRAMQLAAAKALEAGSEWYDGMNELYARRRHLAEEILTILGCEFDSQQSGMFLWGRIPQSYSNGEELAHKLLYGANLFLTPGSIFGSNGNKYIRISLCANEDMLREALNRINKLER